MKAIDEKNVLSVRRDASNNHQFEWSGASPEVRQFIAEREQDWAWWPNGLSALPLASLTVLRPNMPFEIDTPSEGVSIRIRLRYDLGKNPNHALLQKQQSELVYMKIDGQDVQPKEVVLDHDRYLIHHAEVNMPKHVEILARDTSSGRTELISEILA